jgi:hypothetical protein
MLNLITIKKPIINITLLEDLQTPFDSNKMMVTIKCDKEVFIVIFSQGLGCLCGDRCEINMEHLLQCF